MLPKRLTPWTVIDYCHALRPNRNSKELVGSVESNRCYFNYLVWGVRDQHAVWYQAGSSRVPSSLLCGS